MQFDFEVKCNMVLSAHPWIGWLRCFVIGFATCSDPASCDMQGHALRQGLRLKKPSAPAAPFVGVFELGGASAQVMQK